MQMLRQAPMLAEGLLLLVEFRVFSGERWLSLVGLCTPPRTKSLVISRRHEDIPRLVPSVFSIRFSDLEEFIPNVRWEEPKLSEFAFTN